MMEQKIAIIVKSAGSVLRMTTSDLHLMNTIIPVRDQAAIFLFGQIKVLSNNLPIS
jgi:hypothetical protein